MDARTTTETLRQHGRFVHALARALLRDPAAADDVAQETWLQWWRRAEAPANPRGWLARVVRSLASNQRRANERRARREGLGAQLGTVPMPDEDAAEAELLHRVVDAVYALEEPYRETILARYFRAEDARALAEASGIPLATVRSRERRALEKLRARLDREAGGRSAWAVALARLAPLETTAAGALLVPWLLVALLVTAGALAWRTSRPQEPRAEPALAHALPTPAFVEGPPAPGLEAATAPGARTEVAPLAESGAEAVGGGADDSTASTLSGRTQDPEGNALGGVRLRFLRVGQELGHTTSDAEGRFELAGLASFREVEAELAGYRFLHATDPEPDPLQPYQPLRVTLVPVGELVVSVRDEQGRALEGICVSAFPRPEELVDTSGNEPSLGWQHAPIEAETDETGRAVLPAVWCGVRLTLQLDLESGADSGEVTVERQREGRLVLDDGPGQPIVLAGQTRAFEATWGAEHEVGGLVLAPDGAPVATYIEATDLGYARGVQGHALANGRSDERGRYLLTFRPAALRGPVRVVARGPGRPMVTRGGAGPVTMRVPDTAAEHVLTRAELEAREPVLLTLAPDGFAVLTGALFDPRGAPVHDRAHQLLLLREGSAVPATESVCARSSDGGFFFPRLTPGPLELVVASRDALERAQVLGEPAFVRFAGLAASSDGHALNLPDSAPVRLRIRGEALQSFSLARLFPADPRAFPRTPAERTLTLETPAFWLPGGNGERLERPEGTWLIAGDKLRGQQEVELPLGEPGWYRIGVTSAAPHAPVASELLWFEPGEYVLDVQPPPATGILRGRLEADGTRDFYGLVLSDERGRPLPIAAPSSGERLDVYRLQASGAFLLRELAVGRYRLRAGTCDELAAGGFARELALEILPGENVLEIRL